MARQNTGGKGQPAPKRMTKEEEEKAHKEVFGDMFSDSD
jgi:hypothetical protein